MKRIDRHAQGGEYPKDWADLVRPACEVDHKLKCGEGPNIPGDPRKDSLDHGQSLGRLEADGD